MAKKKVGRPRKRGRKKVPRIKVKGYTKTIAVFNGVAKAHARRVKVKPHTRKRQKKN